MMNWFMNGYERYKRIEFGDWSFNDHVKKKVDGFECIHEGNGIGQQNLEGKMLLEFCHQKDLYVVNTWFNKEKRKVT